MTFELDEAFACDAVPAEVMDVLWERGWRHFGRIFYRYSRQETSEGETQTITPLRVRLADWSPTKSQRRVLRRNAGLRWEIAAVALDDEMRALFHRHKARFKENVPESIEDFLGQTPEEGPCDCRMLRVYEAERLLAVSFFDMGEVAVSSVYALFEPEASWRSLGIFTMLLELQHARDSGLTFLYPGYATHEASVYDYKKQFRALQWLDFEAGEWRAMEA